MRPLDGYPDSWGAKRAAVIPHAGPASYTQITTTSPAALPTSGGDLVEASEAGMKLIDYVQGGLSDDGLYFVRAIPVQDSSQFQGASQPTYRLVWYVEATGAEVAGAVDLSAEVVRLLVVGPK